MFREIARDDFRDWLDDHEGDLRRWHYEPLTETTGRVVVYSLPTFVHATTSRKMNDMVKEQLDAVDPQLWHQTIIASGDITCNVIDREQEPDESYIPIGAPFGAYPTVVVDVAYTHESRDLLVAKLRRWMHPETHVQVAIGIKIETTMRANIERTTIELIKFERNAEFDPAQPNAADRVLETCVRFEAGRGLPDEPVVIPWSALFHGIVLQPAIVDAQDRGIIGVVIDLHGLRERIDIVTRGTARRASS